MNISLLYAAELSATEISKTVLYDLSLDKSFSAICSDSKKRATFLDILSRPLHTKAEIGYRQEILRDFTENPESFEALARGFDRLCGIFADDEKQRAALFRERGIHVNEKSVASARNHLQIASTTLKRCLLELSTLDRLFETFPVKSHGLCALRDKLRGTVRTAEFDALLRWTSKFETYSAVVAYDCRLRLGASGKVEVCQLIPNTAKMHATQDPQKKTLRFFQKQRASVHGEEAAVKLNAPPNALTNRLMADSILDIAELFDAALRVFAADYRKISGELDFYAVALRYCAFLMQKGASLVYPEFYAEDGMRLTGAYDLFLATQRSALHAVSANDIESGNKNGILVFGANGSGKTVFLRTVGTIQVLAQAGLPVLCNTAKLRLYRHIATVFSRSEDKTALDSNGGRFEQEVGDFKEILDFIGESTLVLLNETFQTTAYEEGADALYWILKYLTYQKADWMLVTHIRQLIRLLLADNVLMLTTGENFRILPWN